MMNKNTHINMLKTSNWCYELNNQWEINLIKILTLMMSYDA